MRKKLGWIAATVAVLVAATVGAVVLTRDRPMPDLSGAIYLNPAYSPEERAADLVARMSLAEKASQMISSQAAAIPRLGVRAYGWWNEAIHGVAREGLLDGSNPPELVNTTSYPVSLSLGSTWNPDLMYEIATAISDEAREVVRDNTLDLNFYSPTINLARDPRWGRNDEAYSEDPFLTAAIAAQYVNGMEGKDADGELLPEGGGFLKTLTTLKHYAANNSEFNRRSGSSDMDDRTLREYYTAQFRSVVRSSQPASIMTAYNRLNGVPASADAYLLETLGRQTFGFEGFYTSDCDSIYEIEAGHKWGGLDRIQRHAAANAAGVDLNCQLGYHDSFNYANALPAAVERGHPESAVDASLVRLFAARIRLGEFDDPATVPWVTAARSRVPAGTWVSDDSNGAVTQTPERLDLARRAAAESIVLLRNDGALLPLRPGTGTYRVAVLGAAESLYLGGYSSRQGTAGLANHVSVLDGITTAAPSATVDHLNGPDQLDRLAGYDAVVVYATTDASVAAEDTDRRSLDLPGGQAELIREAVRRNPNTVVYAETVGQVTIPAEARAVLWSSYNGQRKGEALADVLFGRLSPSGHLPFTWYTDAAQLPAIGDYAIRPGVGSLGRTYLYFTGDVAYPFGHGLSYTDFAYSPARASADRATAGDTVTVTVDVTNTGPVAGAEVVQLYAATPGAAAELERPRRRLVGFEKVFLQPGETGPVTFSVRVADLAFFDGSRFAVDPGDYAFEVGASATDARSTALVTVSGDLTPVPVALTVRPHGVVFDQGVEIAPEVTVAMNDDTLLDAEEVTYVSNRPSVVSVDPDGSIRTVGPGVATVTATLGARSTTFVVVVR